MARNILEDGTYTTSQYTKNLAQWKSDDEEYTYWESQFLNPLKSTYEAAEQTAKTTAGYDITGAYKNYLNYQTQLAQSNLLGTSQSKLGEQSKLGYQSAYSSALSDYYKTTAKAYDEYQTGLASAQEEISAIGEQLKSFDELANEFIAGNYSSYGYSTEDIKNMYSKNELGEDVLTDLGRNVYANVLESIDSKTGRNVFYDYLKEQDEELYEFALQNPDMLREVLFGYSSDEAEDKSRYKYDLSTLESKLKISKTEDKINPEESGKQYDTFKLSDWDKDAVIYTYKNQYGKGRVTLDSPEIKEYIQRNNIKPGDVLTVNDIKYVYLDRDGGKLYEIYSVPDLEEQKKRKSK